MTARLDQFIPRPDVRKRPETTVQAPAWVVYEVAGHFDMPSMPIVRALCWRRARMLGAIPGGARHPQGSVAEMLQLGGGRLAEDPGRWFMAGAPCQPWQAERDFYGIPHRIGMSHPLALDQLHLLLKDGDVAELCKQNGLHACPLPVHGRRHWPHCLHRDAPSTILLVW